MPAAGSGIPRGLLQGWGKPRRRLPALPEAGGLLGGKAVSGGGGSPVSAVWWGLGRGAWNAATLKCGTGVTLPYPWWGSYYSVPGGIEGGAERSAEQPGDTADPPGST